MRATRHRVWVTKVAWPAVSLVAALLVGKPALGSGAAGLAKEIDELDRLSRALSVRAQAQAATSQQLAEHRLVDGQVLYNLRDYTRAAIVLLDYTAKYKDTRGYPEALYYLADSLHHKGDYLSARRYFRKIVNEVRGKYYQDALQRLVELSLRTGDSSQVTRYLAALANIPPHELKPSVPYVKGKYYFFKQRTDDALGAFRTIQPGKKYYLHAQYFIGACLVRKKDYAAAVKHYKALLRIQPRSSSDKQIRELAYLALARLYYQRGEIKSAIKQYQKISRRSREFDTALYEICWAYIKAGDYRPALRALDLLILAQPDSPFAPEVRVLQGNLLIRLGEWSRATELFTKAREKFLPVHRRMNQLLADHEDPRVFFDTLLERNIGAMAATADVPRLKVPKLALYWVKERPKVRRALNLVKNVREIEASLKEIKQLIRRLERAINSPAKINIFPEFATAQTKALEIENRLARARRKILAREAELTASVASGAEKQKLKDLAQRREAMRNRITSLPTSAKGYQKRRQAKVTRLSLLDKELSKLSVMIQGQLAQLVAAEKYYADTAGAKSKDRRAAARAEISQVRTSVSGLNKKLEALKQLLVEAKDLVGVGGPSDVAERDLKRRFATAVKREHEELLGIRGRLSGSQRAEFDQLAGLLQRSVAIETTVTSFNKKIADEVDRKLTSIRAVLVEEQQLASKHSADIAEYGSQTNEVAGKITYDGFRAVSGRFQAIVVRADVGIIDVAWALKDQKSKQVSRMVQQQKLDLKLLDDEFRELLKEE